MIYSECAWRCKASDEMIFSKCNGIITISLCLPAHPRWRRFDVRYASNYTLSNIVLQNHLFKRMRHSGKNSFWDNFQVECSKMNKMRVGRDRVIHSAFSWKTSPWAERRGGPFRQEGRTIKLFRHIKYRYIASIAWGQLWISGLILLTSVRFLGFEMEWGAFSEFIQCMI